MIRNLDPDIVGGLRAPSLPDVSQQYVEGLSSLFDWDGVDPIDFASALLRAGGMENGGWDPLAESRAFLSDLVSLQLVELPRASFASQEATRWRLALLAYAHLVEMDGPYEVLMNLTRVRAGKSHVVDPFRSKQGKKRLYPADKIKRIGDAVEEQGRSTLRDLFGSFYDNNLRNAVSHSDFIIHPEGFRSRGSRFRESAEYLTFSQQMSLERLEGMLSNAFGFYSALFQLHATALRELPVPSLFVVDEEYKGVGELIVESGALRGFVIHWPNGLDSIYRRTPDGCDAINVSFGSEGEVVPVVIAASRPSSFSPLVAIGEEARYDTKAARGDACPSWASAVSIGVLRRRYIRIVGVRR